MSSDTARTVALEAIAQAAINYDHGRLTARDMLAVLDQHAPALTDDRGETLAWADAVDVDRNEVPATELQPGEVRDGYRITAGGWVRDYHAVGAGEGGVMRLGQGVAYVIALGAAGLIIAYTLLVEACADGQRRFRRALDQAFPNPAEAQAIQDAPELYRGRAVVSYPHDIYDPLEAAYALPAYETRGFDRHAADALDLTRDPKDQT